MADNAILSEITACGASAATAAQDHLGPGVTASRTMAKTDMRHVVPLKPCFEAAAEAHGLPPALLAAITSRESRGGTVLDEDGYGDGGQAFGVMQVDKRFHALEGLPDPRSAEHIRQASAILSDCVARIADKFPDANEAQQLMAAVSAYNCGVAGVASVVTADARTTGHDYGNDVWVRATVYAVGW